jgi:biopolymer transport protein ExbB
MNLGNIFAHDNPVLTTAFILLVGMSLASWYIVFWKALTLHKDKQSLKAFCNQYIKTPDWPLHAKFKEISGSVEILVREAEKLKPIMKPYKHEERKEILSMHLVQNLDLIRVHLDRGLTVLASIGSSAPFIGLFGTVVGIVGALTKIAKQGNAGLDVVAGPMGEALIATAIGLFAAIPAVLAYNAYVRFNRLLVQDLRHIAEQLTTYLSLTPSSIEKNNE